MAFERTAPGAALVFSLIFTSRLFGLLRRSVKRRPSSAREPELTGKCRSVSIPGAISLLHRIISGGVADPIVVQSDGSFSQ